MGIDLGISSAAVYSVADKTYANCLPCLVNPERSCEICNDTTCLEHAVHVSLYGKVCPLCLAIMIVHGRNQLTRTLRLALEKRRQHG